MMTLGMAEDLERDPAQVHELVTEAKGQARLAIRELRNLARGIAPPILVVTPGLPATLEGHAEAAAACRYRGLRLLLRDRVARRTRRSTPRRPRPGS